MEGWGGGVLKGSGGGGGTIGWGFQVMLIPLIYLISGWRWALFTSDVPLLGKTDEREGNREREWWGWVRMNGYQKMEQERQRRRIAEWFPGPGGGMAGARCDCASWSRNEVRCGWTFDRPPGSTSFACLWSRAGRAWGISSDCSQQYRLPACLPGSLTDRLADWVRDYLPTWSTE